MVRTTNYLIIAYIIMLMVVLILPFYSSESYSIILNTTSQLGAQQTPNAWIMNLTFVLLGLGSILSGWKILKGYTFHRVVLVLFGLSLVLAAIFHHAPVNTNLEYDLQQDWLHSVFASATGFSFTVFALSVTFIVEKKIDGLLAISAGILAMAFSMLMFNIPELMGIWQRLLFISCFGWLIYLFSNADKLKKR
ncbi:MAG: DUF998 domain-containing protein [Cyclobacteriaceae bacterium]|nr:DUF998 domain-containing protein [Cyclobacteriaceae bacterium]